MTSVVHKVCKFCGQSAPATEMTVYGNDMVEKVCKTNYNRQLERTKKDAALKKWWQALTPAEKIAWCIRVFQNQNAKLL